MGRFQITFAVLILFSVFYNPTNAQVFNIEDYQEFLQQHQNMSTTELLQMHPAGIFTDQINSNYTEALYFDSIDAYYNLTEYEKSLIGDHGFMVSERLDKISFGEAILEIFHQDLPVFVSTDAILHAMHISYDRILKDLELGLLEIKLIELLWDLRNSIPQLHSTYANIPDMLTMLKDVDIYVNVPLLLLEENTTPFYPENSTTIDTILNWIYDEQGGVSSTIFSSTCRVMDWSQFKPRGHYVLDPISGISLEGYFRAMMWLGKVELYLIAPRSLPVQCPNQTFEDVQRQAIDAFLIDELFELAAVEPVYEEMENIIKFFVGESDNVTLPNMDYLRQAISLDSASYLLDSLKMVEFQDTLSNQAFAYQLILSQILFSNPMSPDSIVPASAFMLFGQRFVIDSYVTGTVVFDRIKYLGQYICRLYPSTLDVLFPLGNSATAQLLKDELNEYHYSTNLAALRYLIDHYDLDFWESSIYNYWLNSLRKLNPPEDRAGLPDFMQTAAYWQQKMNTQLASWTELRHDNLLYAKQSYTGGGICSYPFSFVEPFPEFYENLRTYSQEAYTFFNSLNIDPLIKNYITGYYSTFIPIADTLQSISEKELIGESFTLEEIIFLKRMLYESQSGCVEEFGGWYSKLFYRDREYEDYQGLLQKDHIVADIHTTPTYCGGGYLGAISHVGTGPVNIGIVVTENHQGELTAFAGPVMSYYEYRTTNFLRLTDDEWANTYLQSALRPDWVNIYLADTSGESRGLGATLITSVENDENNLLIPQTEILVSNYPNPFNPSTIIAFTIPYDLTNSLTELKIYDLQGSLIKTLVNEVLPAGNYLSKWDCKNENSNQVASGVYIYNLKVAYKQKSGKMTLLK
jgi:hypothetical protein